MKEPTLLVMVVGVPNVGKSALINAIHRIAISRYPGMSIIIETFFCFIDNPCLLFR
jgi:ribosome biogenesis GTPase A